MKRIFLFLMCFCCLLPISIGGTTSNNNRDEEEIDLLGDLPKPILKSLVNPIQAFITDQFIDVVFNSAIGTIEISIYDETENIVYQRSVDTYAGQHVFIDITSFEEGVYTIEFVNSKNEYLAGEFEI